MEQQLRALGLSSAVQAWIMSSLKTTARGSEFAFDLDGKGAYTQNSPSLPLVMALLRCGANVQGLLQRRLVARRRCAAPLPLFVYCAI